MHKPNASGTRGRFNLIPSSLLIHLKPPIWTRTSGTRTFASGLDGTDSRYSYPLWISFLRISWDDIFRSARDTPVYFCSFSPCVARRVDHLFFIFMMMRIYGGYFRDLGFWQLLKGMVYSSTWCPWRSVVWWDGFVFEKVLSLNWNIWGNLVVDV